MAYVIVHPLKSVCRTLVRLLARKEKNYVSHALGNKMQLGSNRHCESLSEFSGRPGDQTLGKFTIFSFELV